MWVKICGTTNLEDALLSVQAGADAVGFIFAPSKRQVTPEEACEISSELPAGVERVGVFACDDADQVEQVVGTAGLTAVQLHCTYRAALVQALRESCGSALKIIQTIAYEVDAVDRANADARFEAALRLVFANAQVWAVLLDVMKSGASGGLGVAFDWEHAARIVERTRKAFPEREMRVILAGGLRPENVTEGIAALRPWGVDVVSGVESVPGKKDQAKVKAFLARAQEGPDGIEPWNEEFLLGELVRVVGRNRPGVGLQNVVVRAERVAVRGQRRMGKSYDRCGKDSQSDQHS